MMDPTAIFWRPRVPFRMIFSQLSTEMTIYLNFSEAGPGYRGLRLLVLMEVIFCWVFGFHLWVFQTPQKYRRRKRTSVSPLQKPESPAVHDF